jgi:hypothetical protein
MTLQEEVVDDVRQVGGGHCSKREGDHETSRRKAM